MISIKCLFRIVEKQRSENFDSETLKVDNM